jgi:hypothetical protein
MEESLLELQNAIDTAASELESWNAVIPFSVIKPYSVEPMLSPRLTLLMTIAVLLDLFPDSNEYEMFG